jgi:hypothetical protein
MTEELRETYLARNKRELSKGLRKLEARYKWPGHAFRAEASRLGLSQGGHRRGWTAAEEDYLRERVGIVNVGKIARSMKRTVLSVECKADKLQLSVRVREGYCVADLCEVFGAHYSTVRSWMRRGLFGKVKEEGISLRVAERDVHRFLRTHAREYDLRRVDQVWFVAMVFGHLAGRGGQM